MCVFLLHLYVACVCGVYVGVCMWVCMCVGVHTTVHMRRWEDSYILLPPPGFCRWIKLRLVGLGEPALPHWAISLVPEMGFSIYAKKDEMCGRNPNPLPGHQGLVSIGWEAHCFFFLQIRLSLLDPLPDLPCGAMGPWAWVQIFFPQQWFSDLPVEQNQVYHARFQGHTAGLQNQDFWTSSLGMYILKSYIDLLNPQPDLRVIEPHNTK